MREGEKSWAVFLLRNRAEHGVLLPQASSPPETAEDKQDLPRGKIVSKAKFVTGINNLPFFFFFFSFLPCWCPSLLIPPMCLYSQLFLS